MGKRAKVIVSVALGFSVLVVVGFFAVPHVARSFLYPDPPSMPAEVADTMQVVVGHLEALLRTNAPKALAALNPGLSEETLLKLERDAGITLPDDMKTLYRWHDGQSTNTVYYLVPGHRFMPLAESLAERERLRKDVAASSVTQRAAFSVFAGHRDGWLTVFDDRAGDGYFLDTKRTTQPGHFFFNMAEVRYYVFFPSVHNFIAGLVECYSKKTIRFSEKDDATVEDYALSQSIWMQFGSPIANE